jgi:acyl-CoA thioester hydrolase
MRSREQQDSSVPPAVYRFQFTVSDEAIDRNGHVNNVVFVQWMQDAAVRHFLAAGAEAAMAAFGGTWVVRSHRIEYLSPVHGGDRLEVQTWVEEYRRVRSLRRYEFIRLVDGSVAARGETEWVFVDADTHRPMAIPEEIRRRLTEMDAKP